MNRIPIEGMDLEEEVAPADMDLDTETITFCAPLRIRANVSRITNAVTVNLDVRGFLCTSCSRCLDEVKIELSKEMRLNYPIDTESQTIDLNPDIREEIILDYPLQPLCNSQCKGLCPRCGKNLNEGTCNCK